MQQVHSAEDFAVLLDLAYDLCGRQEGVDGSEREGLESAEVAYETCVVRSVWFR